MRVSQVIYENLDSNIGENAKTGVTGSLIKNGKPKQDEYLLSDVKLIRFNFTAQCKSIDILFSHIFLVIR